MARFRRVGLDSRLLLLTFAGLVAGADAATAQDAGATCTDVKGVLLTRTGQKWLNVKAGDAVAPGTALTSLFEAHLVSANKAVGVKLLADAGLVGPLSVLESAIRVLDAGSADLALEFDRGLVVLTNLKESGPATAILKIHGEELTVTLKTPKSKLGIELYGRHPGGAGHILKDDPTLFFYALVVDGEATLSTKKNSYELKAAPGNASLRWDSATKQADVISLETFPPELKRTDAQLKGHARLCTIAESLASKAPSAAAAELLMSTDALERRVAVTAFGAVDDLEHVLAALEDSKNKDVREQAILVLRSWMGRAPGQIKGVRLAMLKHKYTLPQVKMSMQLLVGFDQQERERPGVYELLINLLDSKYVGVRELAHWHLVRLAPSGRDIPYDAGAAESDRKSSIDRWRQLVPPGELPPAPKVEKK